MVRTKDDYYIESKRIRNEVLAMAEALEGKHEESAYFAYFDREIGVKTILAMRKMKNGGQYKPYAIIDQYAFENNVGELEKGTPL
jgi:hypothetical protein